MSEGVSPTLRLWQVAEFLRERREQLSLTMDEAAKRLQATGTKSWSRSKVQRIEHRLYVPKAKDVEQIIQAYELPESEAAELLQMCQEARTRGWWQSSALPSFFHTMAGLERAAESIRQYEVMFIPGLLQTPEYVRTLVTTIERFRPPEELEGLIAARLTRQHVLENEAPPHLHVILAEATLRWPVGGTGAMRDQIQHLVDSAANKTAVLQVLPFECGANPGLEGPFTVLTLPQLPNDLGYVEGMMGSVYLESQDDVRHCVMRFATLSEQALSPTASTKFLRTILAEYK